MNDNPLYDELEDIRKIDHEGLLRPEAIVEYAEKNRNSILHQSFEWDDGKAAYNYRLWQARQLIVRVTIEATEGRFIQAYVSLTSNRIKGGYRSMVEVFMNNDTREELLMDALEELNRIKAKYRELKELEKIFAEIDKVQRKSK